MSEYDFEISHRPDCAFLTVHLEAGRIFRPSQLPWHPWIAALNEISTEGRLIEKVGRAFGGESMVMNTFTAEEAGEVTFAPGPMGDCMHYPVTPPAGLCYSVAPTWRLAPVSR